MCSSLIVVVLSLTARELVADSGAIHVYIFLCVDAQTLLGLAAKSEEEPVLRQEKLDIPKTEQTLQRRIGQLPHYESLGIDDSLDGVSEAFHHECLFFFESLKL